MKQKVYILGAGVGGLACAHELAKNSNYEINIYERNKEIGGQARSSVSSEQKHSEYCWHAFSSGYRYFLNILDKVTDAKNVKLISHLKPLNKFIYAFNKKNYTEYGNSFITEINSVVNGFEKMYGYPIPFLDQLKLAQIFIRANTLCEKNLEKYDKIKWADYLGDVSPEVRRWVLDSTAIYLGMDYANLSTHFMFHLMRANNSTTLLDSTHVFYSLDGPMSEVLFDHWQTYLENKGVHFHLNRSVTSIDIENSIIHAFTVKCNDSEDEEHRIYLTKNDIIVNALSADQLAYLIPTTNNTLLDLNSRQIQTQVLYYLPYRVQPIGTDPTIVILPDTPWFLMTRIEGDLWETETDYLSTGIGIWDTPGICGKPAIECTREELAIECWAQIYNSKHNLKLPITLPDWNIWNSFQYNNETKKMSTYEPKFSNNINTLIHRPNIKDKNIKNLYNATAYTKTNMNIFNMESGVEAGVKAALSIQGETIPEAKSDSPKNWFFKFCQWVDQLFS